jgi:hypothetical protein
VVIAGPNGVGKTRLLNAILASLRNPGASPSQSHLIVSATHDREREEWGLEQLDSAVPDQAAKLRTTLQRQQRRGNWKSSAFHFDSTRQFSQVQQLAWNWNFADPAEEMIGWDFLFNPFQQRFQDTIHAIYRMLGHHRAEIARRAIELQRAGEKHLPLDFPDPLASFRDAFGLLLGPKQLADIDINNPQIRYLQDGTTLGIDSLSPERRRHSISSLIFCLDVQKIASSSLTNLSYICIQSLHSGCSKPSKSSGSGTSSYYSLILPTLLAARLNIR